MQIHEVTKIKEAVGDLVQSGLAQLMSRGAQDPARVQAANQARIDKVATQALPLWQAKRTQLEQTLGQGQVNFDEELESWIEENILRGTLKIEQLDPQYQNIIKQQITVVNNTQNPTARADAFKRLIGAAVLARPARSQALAVSQSANTNQAIDIARGVARANQQGANIDATRIKLMIGGAVTNVPRATIERIVGSPDEAAAVADVLTSANITVG